MTEPKRRKAAISPVRRAFLRMTIMSFSLFPRLADRISTDEEERWCDGEVPSLLGLWYLSRIPPIDWAGRTEGRGNAGQTADSFFHPSGPSGFSYLIPPKSLIRLSKLTREAG